jgi:hypothetical protein
MRSPSPHPKTILIPLLLCSCAPQTGPDRVLFPPVQIVADSSGGYCRMESTATGRNLIVRLRNPTPITKPPINVEVGFTGNPPAMRQVTSPAIPGPGTIDVPCPFQAIASAPIAAS